MKSQRGQTLLELLVVLFVVGLIITGVVSVVTVSVRNARFSRDQAQASRFAQEAMEWVRQERDSDWTVFSSHIRTTYCMSTLSWNTATPCSASNIIPNTVFLRNVTLSTVDANTISVEVVVAWTDSAGTHQSRLSTYLTHWK